MKVRRIIQELAAGIALLAVFGFLFFRSCFTSEAEWYGGIPAPLLGDWVLMEAEDATVVRLEMSPRTITLYFDDERGRRQCPVVTVSFLGFEYVIFCGDTNVSHIADFRYSIYLYDSTFIDLGELVATGTTTYPSVGDDDFRYSLGTFAPPE